MAEVDVTNKTYLAEVLPSGMIPVQEYFLNFRPTTSIRKETPVYVFSCEFWEIYLFYRTPGNGRKYP